VEASSGEHCCCRVRFWSAWAKGDWSAAQSKVEDLKRKQMELRKLMPEEVRKMVKTICENAEDRHACPDRARCARNLGERQARESADELNRELEKGDKSDIMKALINKRSDFAKCKQWKWELRCWTLCPDVNDEAEHREDGVRWGSC
jgi:hypothetical protein